MPESFGARLRQRREQQQIALATIAEQTKIKESLLEALERDDVSHWPTGIFRRAFMRSYARAIGLEPDVVVREFSEIHPDPAEVVEALPAVPPPGDRGLAGGRPPSRLRYLAGSALSRLRRGGLQDRPSEIADLAVSEPFSVIAPARFEPAPPSPALFEAEPAPPSPVLFEAEPAPPGPVLHEADAPPSDAVLTHAPPLEAVQTAPDLLATAQLCTELGRVEETREVAPLLREVSRIVDAVGLIVWAWDSQATELRPALAHGYSEKMLAQLPRVRRDTDNATAAAFRSAQTCVVNGSDLSSGALVVPMTTPAGCVGVLAIELLHGSERKESVRALVTIVAAQLARLVGAARPLEADRRLA